MKLGHRYTCYHEMVLEQELTTLVEYERDFIVHTAWPIKAWPGTVWYYPCYFNDRRVRLIIATRDIRFRHGEWGIHYL